VKYVHLTTEQFTPENGMLTDTFKMKRAYAYNKYEAELTALYKN
jgi:long-subunit acyl-CoA synthetase (AMP-forming)